MSTTPLVPAAQYLRMSTDHQQYSLHNQADAILRYATLHGFCIVKTYCDPAKSGLLLKNRAGLKNLLTVVMKETCEFRVVLVYDVSRWGRFQDTDEAAHHEYVCKSSGVPVHYCAEMFSNDDNLSNLILKTIKRTMAGEYSRELSVKVRTGLSRLAKLGYKCGGPAPYGLRRQLLDKQGRPKQVLEFGDRKALADEHVILIPGPQEEVAIVKRIFQEFVYERQSTKSITANLNREGIPFLRGGKWNRGTVRILLQHPHYMGMQVWGRTTELLSSPPKRLPLSQWNICANAFEPIISRELFVRAQQVFANRTFCLSNEQMLQRLKQTLETCGRLNWTTIDESPLCPASKAYRRRFGGLLNAYAQIGYNPQLTLKQAASRNRGMLFRSSLIRSILETFPGQIEEVQRGARFKGILRYRRTGLLIAVIVGWCRHEGKGTSWRVRARPEERKRPAIVALLDVSNNRIASLRIFPKMPNRGQFQIPVEEFKESPKTGVALGDISDLFTVLNGVRQSRNSLDDQKSKL